jgi:hypothetical protein
MKYKIKTNFLKKKFVTFNLDSKPLQINLK